MKKYRKQSVNVFGQKQLVDVPVDAELYKMDNHCEYQRQRSKTKDISLDDVLLADETADLAGVYEEAQLLECLHNALNRLDDNERQLIKYLFHDGLTESKTADIFGVSSTAIWKRKRRIIAKLRNSLIDWA